MIAACTIRDVRDILEPIRRSGACIGFVPTMGALHSGHVSLLNRARSDCAVVVASIFVNPTQFGAGEDYASYPRRLDEDLACCRAAGVDVVFHPDRSEIYSGRDTPWITCGRLGEVLCGRTRPMHFDGVCQVVAKLFNIVIPNRAYFGQKDAQQVVIIRRMVEALDMAVDIVACPTQREPDGLAMSSRNAYLSHTERAQAPVLYHSLTGVAEAVQGGRRDGTRLAEEARQRIAAAGPFEIDYLELVDPDVLEPWDGRRFPVLVAVAARLGSCRLIDNLLIDGVGTSG